MKLSNRLILIGMFLYLSPLAGMVNAAAVGNANLFLGNKSMDSDWEPWDSQLTFGGELDFRKDTWPINIVGGLFITADSENIQTNFGTVETTGRTMELELGVRKYLPINEKVRPFIGVGPALIWAEIEGRQNIGGIRFSTSVDDSALGFWVGGGISFLLGERLNLGVTARYSQADVDLAGVDIDAGGMILAGFFGVHFGGLD